jgi:hypothetical protein
MTTASFQKDSLGWRFQQFTQEINEWFEAFFSDRSSDLPDEVLPQWTIPERWIDGLFWLLVGGMLGWMLWRISPSLKRWGRSVWKSQPWKTIVPAPRSSLVTPQQWLHESERWAKQGNYTEACRSLYLSLLQWFHEQQVIVQHNSRTDREYTQLLPRCLKSFPKIEAATIVLQTHERLCFSHQVVGEEEFLTCRQAYQDIAGQ